MKGVVLVVDNNQAFRETCMALLNEQGYETRAASSPEAARHELTQDSIDLAVIDVRLEDDYNPNDRSGIELAKDKKFRDVPKIILTAYPVSHENASEVLGIPLDGLPVALYIFDKKDIQRMSNSIPELLDIWRRWHGGETQPIPVPLPSDQQEALISGPQRDSRLPFAFVEAANAVARSIARLAVPRIFDGQQQNEWGLGTGWLIAPNLLITNHHVIECRDCQLPPWGSGEAPATLTDFRLQAEQVVARFDFYREQDLIAKPFLECHGARLLASSKQLDYALLELVETDKIADRQPLRLVHRQPALVRGSRLNIVQHPQGGPLQYAIRNNFFVQLGATNDFVRYQTDTERGASGSPVCDDRWQVLALHHASIPALATQIPQEVIDGQPVTVKILNEAIAIHSILANLAQPIRERILTAQRP